MFFFLFINGEGFSPSVKKPKVKNREEGFVSSQSASPKPKPTEKRGLANVDHSTMGFSAPFQGAGAKPFSSCHRRCKLCRNRR